VETYENILDNFCRADFGTYFDRLIQFASLQNETVGCFGLLVLFCWGLCCSGIWLASLFCYWHFNSVLLSFYVGRKVQEELRWIVGGFVPDVLRYSDGLSSVISQNRCFIHITAQNFKTLLKIYSCRNRMTSLMKMVTIWRFGSWAPWYTVEDALW